MAQAQALHRPERRWPLRQHKAPINLRCPPGEAEVAEDNVWQTLLPLLGSLSLVAFAILLRSLVFAIIAIAVATTMVLVARASRRAVVRRESMRREEARSDWCRHARDVERRASISQELQRDALSGLYPDLNQLGQRIFRDHIVWERRPSDLDFAHVRLGLGEVAATNPVVLLNGEQLYDADPALVAVAEELTTSFERVASAPVVVPVRDLGVIAIVGEPGAARELAANWLTALAALHAPDDLRFMGLVPSAATAFWDWLKWLPHTRDPLAGEGFDRMTRTVTSDEERFLEAISQLGRERNEQWRRSTEPSGWRPQHGAARVAAEHVILLIDQYDPTSSLYEQARLDTLLESAAELAISAVVTVSTRADIPRRAGAVVELADGVVRYREAGPDGRYESGVVPDRFVPSLARDLARRLAPVRLRREDTGLDTAAPIRLVELLNLGTAKLPPEAETLGRREAVLAQLEHHEAGTVGVHKDLLQAPIGLDDAGAPLILNLNESAMQGVGPHGLLVGATGSGKSELLRSLLLGLAVKHEPDLLNFVMVDFKGGAAFGDLHRLPHSAGLVTNLEDDVSNIDRLQEALEGELSRRLGLLRRADNAPSIREYHEQVASEHFPYLLIVVDEFSELLAVRPDFLDTLVRIGRLGRSLGMHLLLSSQRLEEGRLRGLETHLRYKICLRTFSPQESQMVIGSPQAYALAPVPGLGYARLDDTVVRFKAAISTLAHRHVEGVARGPAIVQPFLLVSGSRDEPRKQKRTAAAQQTDLQVLVAKLSRQGVGSDDVNGERTAAASGESAERHPLWLTPLRDRVSLGQVDARRQQLRAQRGAQPNAQVGLLDLPRQRLQPPLTLNLRNAHVALAGGPRTGKSTFLRTLIADLSRTYQVEQLQIFVIDMGGGTLLRYAALPHVAGMTGPHEPEGVQRLLRELNAILEERSQHFRAAQVNALEDLRASAYWREQPRNDLSTARMLVAIDNIGALRADQPSAEVELTRLATAGLQFGVHLAMTANRWLDFRPSLLDLVSMRLELKLNDPADSLVGRPAASNLVAGVPGRGLTLTGDAFQLAMPSLSAAVDDADDDLPQVLAAARAVAAGREAPRVEPLPLRVRESEVPDLLIQTRPQPALGAGFLLGIDEFRYTPVHLHPLAPGQHLVIYGDDGSGRSTLLERLVRWLLSQYGVAGINVHIVDLRRGLLPLADVEGVKDYLFTPSQVAGFVEKHLSELRERMPAPQLSREQLGRRDWWAGPEHVLVVDDYDLTVSGGEGPLSTLAGAVDYARDVGWHIFLARRVTGAQSVGFEPLVRRLREVGADAVLLSGDRAEGPLVEGQAARNLPAGRGIFVRRGTRPSLLQLCLPG